ncbi:hypothetical protein NE699_24425, partial [Escherichia coli]|uniref:hypothetical protein n=1 Tax=Escherichia coli TaxID=562 RepID=UPI00210CEBBE
IESSEGKVLYSENLINPLFIEMLFKILIYLIFVGDIEMVTIGSIECYIFVTCDVPFLVSANLHDM